MDWLESVNKARLCCASTTTDCFSTMGTFSCDCIVLCVCQMCARVGGLYWPTSVLLLDCV